MFCLQSSAVVRAFGHSHHVFITGDGCVASQTRCWRAFGTARKFGQSFDHSARAETSVPSAPRQLRSRKGNEFCWSRLKMISTRIILLLSSVLTVAIYFESYQQLREGVIMETVTFSSTSKMTQVRFSFFCLAISAVSYMQPLPLREEKEMWKTILSFFFSLYLLDKCSSEGSKKKTTRMKHFTLWENVVNRGAIVPQD